MGMRLPVMPAHRGRCGGERKRQQRYYL